MGLIYLAVYKGEGKLFNRLIRLWTRSRYSHCELVMPDGRWLSASAMDGGVRAKHIELDFEHWELIPLPWADAKLIESVFARHEGKGYDWLGILLAQFLPLGIDLTESRFLDAFLLLCALQDSPLLESDECHACTDNFLSVVKEGRLPGLQLQRNGQPMALQSWASELLEQILPLAELLDQNLGSNAHSQALQVQQAKVADPSLTPSAQVLAQLQQGLSFSEFALRQSKQHAEYFRSQPLSAEQQAAFEARAAQSLQDQAELEAQDEGDFDSFAAAYQASILAPTN